MKTYVLKKYKGVVWGVAELFVCEGDPESSLFTSLIKINLFYEVDSNWFSVYDTIGGTGTGWRKGELIRKINISDGEYIVKEE